MRICASLDSYEEKDKVSKADMVEVRTDLLNNVPDIPDREMIVTYRGDIDLSILPEGFKGMIDVGEQDIPSTILKVISSYHNFDRTPESSEILSILNSMKGDISKGAFMVNSFTDLHSIHTAATSMEKEHVVLGMGDMGTIARIRQDILGNAFTFAYIERPTAPGQLDLDTMYSLKNDCMITGLVGHPLSKSLSPNMHNVAFSKSGIDGIYLKFDTMDLEHIEDVIREYDVRGINVTLPHKTSIIGHLDRIDTDAEHIGAVNTVVNDSGRLTGYNTDIDGIDIALQKAGFDPKDKKALIMGYGGAAKACTYFLMKNGCDVTITGRDQRRGERMSKEMGCEFVSRDPDDIDHYDLIVNCTPIGMYEDAEYPIDLRKMTSKHTIFDMIYNIETPFIKRARSLAAPIACGENMLAGQGSTSFKLWTGFDNGFDIMRGALL